MSQSQFLSVAIGVVGLLFFLGWAAHAYYRGTASDRRYVPALLIISVVCLNILIRGLFFSHLSPHPASRGGMFRIANGILALAVGIMLEREWRKQRIGVEHYGALRDVTDCAPRGEYVKWGNTRWGRQNLERIIPLNKLRSEGWLWCFFPSACIGSTGSRLECGW
jgi:hypothetical protein